MRFQGSDGSVFSIQMIRFDAKHSFPSVYRQEQPPWAYTSVIAFVVNIGILRLQTSIRPNCKCPIFRLQRIVELKQTAQSVTIFVHKRLKFRLFTTLGKLHATIFQLDRISSCARHQLIRHEESLEKAVDHLRIQRESAKQWHSGDHAFFCEAKMYGAEAFVWWMISSVW